VRVGEPGASATGVSPANQGKTPVAHAPGSPPIEIDEPPPLAEWLKGRTVLTVAQDGSGQFKTIQAAVDALQAGQVVKVLDKGPYRERLDVPAMPKDTGLVSEVQTILEATDWKRWYTDRTAGEAVDIYVAHKLNRPEGFRLHGFELRFPNAEGKRVKLLASGATKGTFVLENCAILATADSNGASLELSDRVQATNDGLGMSICVRDCVFRECLVLSAHHVRVPPDPDHLSTAVVEHNYFTGTGTEFQLMFAGQSMDKLAIRHNVFAGKSKRDVHMHAVDAAALELSNNTLTSTVGLSIYESIPKGAVTIRNNLRSQEGFIQLEGGAEQRLTQASRSWIVDHNTYPDPPAGASRTNALPRSPGDVPAAPRFLSKVLQEADFLRIPADDPGATGGAGGAWPSYIGALPPGPAPADGDWFTRLRAWNAP